MCELLGLSFNQLVRASLSFRGFRHRGEHNPHGWGLASFPDGSAQVFKEPVRAHESRLSEFVQDYPFAPSNTFIGHVRYGNVGGCSLKNTHPFCRELGGKHYVFAHNGTLQTQELPERAAGPFAPVGYTDSEQLFCSLLNWLAEDRSRLLDFGNLERWLTECNHCGCMNVLFSDGEHLFAYRDAAGYNGLCFTRRKAPYGTVLLRDEDWEAALHKEKEPGQYGYVIASHPLTDESWHDFAPGSLAVFRAGDPVHCGESNIDGGT